MFAGEFVKAVLKINNIAAEVERVAEFVGNLVIVEKTRSISAMTLKYIATNQSLYV